MISLETARKLLNFESATSSIPHRVAEEQLQGAVALHNILERNKAAYLADEVGMGKTYVALGTLALFRHFNPGFRLLVIAPRENIQRKWIKELKNFVANNVRFPDLRVKALHGAPVKPAVSCSNLLELVRETSLNPDRDFFIRLTSFSMPLGKDPEGWKRKRNELLNLLPWMDRAEFNLHDKEQFKAQFARAICTALPEFDLIIFDEGHNLKHGFSENVSARNKALALAFGHPEAQANGFRSYGPRARRILFLSATPLEDDYRQIWNQLNVFGLGNQAFELQDSSASEEKKRECAQNFLIRRVAVMETAGKRLTKNLYRREWHKGGVESFDDPLKVPDQRQRLIVALAQKKVSEILGHEHFNNSFQIGMLASFESFLETTKVKAVEEEDAPSTFDDADQTENLDERVGIDVDAINSMARSYRKRFGTEPPHPKMDSLVNELAANFKTGDKALVFVRRVASVKDTTNACSND
jgi:Rad3-related DNA helicase